MEKNEVIQPFDTNIKLMYHTDKINEFLNNGYTTPVMWELDLTYNCNHNCIGCYDFGAGGRISNVKNLDLKTVKNHIDQIYDLGAKSICLTGGGEPLLYKDITDIIIYIKNKGLDVSLTTNGSLLNKNNIPIILENCTWVRISLDAGCRETFEKIHGVDDFDNIVKNIYNLSSFKNKIKSKCTIGVGFLTSNKNIDDMEIATKLCKKLEVDYIQFRSFHLNYDDPYQIGECKKIQTDNFKVYYLDYKYEKIQKQYKKCYGQHFSGVLSLGKVFVCCHFRNNDKYEIGDLREDTLEKIWKSEKRTNIIDNIDLSKCIPSCRMHKVNIFLSSLVNDEQSHKNFI